MSRFYIIMIIFFAMITVNGQSPFSLSEIHGLKEYMEFHCQFEDFNNDGIPDLFICGQTQSSSGCAIQTEIYYFSPPHSFTPSGMTLPAVQNGSSILWDYDMDGDGDIIYSGMDDKNNPQLYIMNNENNQYSQFSHSIPALSFCKFDLTDMNQDGKYEILYGGINTLKSISFYLIEWNGHSFSYEELELPQLFPYSHAFFDINLDGLGDVFFTGKSIQGQNTNQIYINSIQNGLEQDNRFSNPSLNISSLSPFDMDGDGDWDLIFSGKNNKNTPLSGIFLNQPTGFLDFHYKELSQLTGHTVTADFTGNGFPDIFNWGLQADYSSQSVFLQNLGNIEFQSFPIYLNLYQGFCSKGDFNLDSKPDIIAVGLDSLNHFLCYLLENKQTQNQISPQLPDSLFHPEITRQWIEFSSSYASDDVTNTLSLLYQYRLGKQNSPDLLMSSYIQNSSTALLKPSIFHRFYQAVPPGQYQTQVRILDQSGNFSSWSPALSFHVYSFIPSGESYEGLQKGKIVVNDMNNDGLIDLVCNGFNDKNEPVCLIYQNQNGKLKLSQSLSGTGFGKADVFDLESDGYPEILVSGSLSPETGAGPEKTIFYNNEQGLFSEKEIEVIYQDSSSAKFPQLYESYCAFGHLDHDIYPELILCGAEKKSSNEIVCFYIYSYMGNNRFVYWENHQIPGFKYGGFDFGDINNDGLTDIVVTGLTSGASNNLIPSSRIYIQNDNHTFTPHTNVLEALQYGSQVKLFDFDRDNDLDIFICGGKSLNESYTLLYENQYPSFPLKQSLQSAFVGDIQITDYNQDTQPDLFVSGWSIHSGTSGAAMTKLYKQNNGIYEEDSLSSLPQLYWSAGCWADFDFDGSPDLAVSGIDDDGNYSFDIYSNAHFQIDTVFPKPSAPNCQLTIKKDTLSIHWEKAVDNRNLSTDGLDYFFQIINSNQKLIFSSGKRLFYSQPIILTGLTDGNYILKTFSANNAGCFSADTNQFSFYIDTSPPELSDFDLPQLAGIGNLKGSFSFQDPSAIQTDSPIVISLSNENISLLFQILESNSNSIEGEIYIPDSIPSAFYSVFLEQISDSRNNSLTSPIQICSLYIDTEKPQIMKTIPLPNQSHFSTYSPIKIYFNRNIDESSVDNHFSLTDQKGLQVDGNVTFHKDDSYWVMVFEPSARLSHSETYQLFLSNSIQDTLGNPMANQVIIPFQTAGLTKPSTGTTVFSADSSYCLYIPPFAIQQDMEISFIEKDTLNIEEIEFYSTPFEILPEIEFSNPATLTFYKEKINYPPSAQIFRWDGTQWVLAGSNSALTEFNIPVYQSGIYVLGIKQDNASTTLDTGEEIIINPRVYNPNSMEKPTLDISFFIENSEDVSIYIYDIQGIPVKTVIESVPHAPGNHTVRWKGRNAEGKTALSGLYIAVIKTGSQIRKKTFVIQPY